MPLWILNSHLLETTNGKERIKTIGLAESLNGKVVLEQMLAFMIWWRVNRPLSDNDVENLELLAFIEELQPSPKSVIIHSNATIGILSPERWKSTLSRTLCRENPRCGILSGEAPPLERNFLDTHDDWLSILVKLFNYVCNFEVVAMKERYCLTVDLAAGTQQA